MPDPNRIVELLTFLRTAGAPSLLLQTPPPTLTPQQAPWELTQAQVPYIILVTVAVLAAVFGGLLRPLVEDLGSALLRSIKRLGKAGDFRDHYLTYVIRQNRHLPMLPANVVIARWAYQRQAMELEELYTPLSLGSEGRDSDEMTVPRRYGRRRPRNWLQRLWWRIRPPLEPTAGDVGAVIVAQPRLVVRGDPGSGKSTMLRYMALTAARSLRGNRRDGDDRKLVRRRLGWKQRPLPLLVNLSLLSDVGSWPDGRRLLDEIVDTFPPELRERYPTGYFEKELRRGRCLVLLDGFDELGSRAARGKMARLIDDMAGSYQPRGRNRNLFVVSTRIVGYEGQLNGYGFTVRTVEELDDDAIRTLVERRYQAIAIGEGLGRSAQEQADLNLAYKNRAQQLLGDLRRNDSLRRLTTNPLLLSLIVLVHQVRLKLPEQRHLLYHDCVEILIEKWQASKRDAQGLPTARQPDDLLLPQKMEILQEIALTMQQQRDGTESQAVITREEAQSIIARKLPNYQAATLPEPPDARVQECQRRAMALLDAMFQDSGILVEKGLDSAGEPVVGFSHLTFQEYLAADAIRERPAQRTSLIRNLFNPTWREALLLYVGMTDATDIVRACLAAPDQPALARTLLAARCLAEGITLDPHVRAQVVAAMNRYFALSALPGTDPIVAFIDRVGGERNYDWLLGEFVESLNQAERALFEKPNEGADTGIIYAGMQASLLRVMQSAISSSGRLAAGCVLSAIGDPRSLDEMVAVPGGSFTMGGSRRDDERPEHVVVVKDFRIGKYLVTNGQYEQFVAATGYQSPWIWEGDRCPPDKANHPVVGVSWHDAQAYCTWLSETTGQAYRLPTEAEWEKAARGADGRGWPWGNEEPTPNLCNFDGNVGETTAVGTYPAGASPYGVLDMAGNVWEWTGSLYRPYPYDPADGREDSHSDGARTLRGGSFNHNADRVRCAARGRFNPVDWYDHFGFRVVSPGS